MIYKDIHNTFRTLAQQMGMEINRVILPESIDVYLNNAILEKTKQELAKSITVNAQQDGYLQVPNMSSINTLGNLFRSSQISNIDDYSTIDIMLLLGVSIQYNNDGSDLRHCRIVSFDVIENMIDDYCNRPTKAHPIISTYNNKLILYNDNNDYKFLNIKYLKQPSKIDYVHANDVNVAEYNDFNDSFMYEIIELAVQKYLISVYGRPQSNDGNNNSNK